MLESNPFSNNKGGPKKFDEYLREIIIEAKKIQRHKQDQRLKRIKQKVFNIMGPLAKLWVEVDKIKSSEKSDKMSIEKNFSRTNEGIIS